MRLLVLGVSHHTAPIDVRERLAFATSDLGDAVTALAGDPALGEVVLLSTCNRTELYATCTSLEGGHDALAGFLAAARAVPADALRAHIYTRSEADAARHLFRVAAGLDSLVVGEPQILGQVKQAYASATDQHATGALLNRLFHTAFTAGKRVRSETELAEGAVSVSYAALGLARKICGDLRRVSVLVIGAGEMAELTARHFAAQQPKRIAVCSRTATHAEALATQIGGTTVPWADLDAALGEADIVVTATGATTPILTRPRVHAALRHRRGRPLFLIDIALPRDVDAAVGGRRRRLPLQHRRPAVGDQREPGPAQQRDDAGRGDRQPGSREVHGLGALAHRHADRRRPAPALRGDPPRRARSPAAEDRRPAAGRAGPRRRDHAADHREAADHADRAAQGAARRGAAALLRRRAEPPLRAVRRPAATTSDEPGPSPAGGGPREFADP